VRVRNIYICVYEAFGPHLQVRLSTTRLTRDVRTFLPVVEQEDRWGRKHLFTTWILSLVARRLVTKIPAADSVTADSHGDYAWDTERRRPIVKIHYGAREHQLRVLRSSLFTFFFFSCFSATLACRWSRQLFPNARKLVMSNKKIMVKMARVKRGRARDLRTTAVSPTDPNMPRGFTAGVCSCRCQVRECESAVALQGQFITAELPGLPGRQTSDRPTYYWLLIGYLFKWMQITVAGFQCSAS